MVAIFAREITGTLTGLVKEIDAAVGKNKKKNMAAFLVLMTKDAEGSDKKLKDLAKKEKIEHTPLTVFDDPAGAGPKGYNVSKDAEVTVIMWVGKNRDVQVNHAFGKGELNADAVKTVVADTSKVLAKAGL